QHDVADLQDSGVHRLDGTELPGFDLAPHGVSPGANLNRLTVLQTSDVFGSPSHYVSFRKWVDQGSSLIAAGRTPWRRSTGRLSGSASSGSLLARSRIFPAPVPKPD